MSLKNKVSHLSIGEMLVQKADLCWRSLKGNFLLNNRINATTKSFFPLQTLTNFNRYEIV